MFPEMDNLHQFSSKHRNEVFIPNYTLGRFIRFIRERCLTQRSHGIERITAPKQPADPSLSGGSGDRLASLRHLRAITRNLNKNRSFLWSHDTKSVPIEIAFEDVIDPEVESEVLALLTMLSLTEAESASISLQPDRLTRLAEILASDSSIVARINAAAVIETVAVRPRSAEIWAAVGAAELVIEGLVNLDYQQGNCRVVRLGFRGLFSQCLAKENQGSAVAADAAEVAVRRIGDLVGEGGGVAERLLASVELLWRCDDRRDVAVAGAGGCAAAVNLLVITCICEVTKIDDVVGIETFDSNG